MSSLRRLGLAGILLVPLPAAAADAVPLGAQTLVRTVLARKQPVALDVVFTGDIQAQAQTNVSFRTNGKIAQRLVEVALEAGAGAAYRVDKADELEESWFEGARTVGLTSGASVPEILVREVIEWMQERGFPTVEVARTETESTTFALPRDLRADLKNAGMAPARPHAPRVAGPNHTK